MNFNTRFRALLLLVLLILCGPTAFGQIVSPTGTYPPPPGVPLFDLSTEFGHARYEQYMQNLERRQQYMAEQQRIIQQRSDLERQAFYVRTELAPLYAQHQNDPEWVEAWEHIQDHVEAQRLLGPLRSENGDWLGKDNDIPPDGAPEPVYRQTHLREGAIVRGHYMKVRDAFPERYGPQAVQHPHAQ